MIKGQVNTKMNFPIIQLEIRHIDKGRILSYLVAFKSKIKMKKVE